MGTLQAKRDDWQAQVRAWRESGLSQVAYCAAHGLKPHQLSYWVKRETTQTDTLTFVAVSVPPPQDTGGLVLRGAGHWQLHLPAQASPAWLADLMKHLS